MKSKSIAVLSFVGLVALGNLCFVSSNSVADPYEGVKYCQACHNTVGASGFNTANIINVVAHVQSDPGHEAELTNFSNSHSKASANAENINLDGLQQYISNL